MSSGIATPAIIDAHHHVWDLNRRPQPWTAGLTVLERSFAFADLAPSLDAHGVAATVAVHTVASFAETLELLALAATEPRLVGVVGWFDLTDPALPERIAQARAADGGQFLVGVRHQLQVEPDPRWLGRPDVRAGLAALAEAGLAYDVVVSPSQLPLVADTAAALPQVRFVLDHAGKPPLADGDLTAWAADIAVLARNPNVAVKLSGLVTEADWSAWTLDSLRPVADHVLAGFGAERTMFGSDWPVCLLAASYDEVLTSARQLVSGLTAAEQAAVWGQTARTWYRL